MIRLPLALNFSLTGEMVLLVSSLLLTIRIDLLIIGSLPLLGMQQSLLIIHVKGQVGNTTTIYPLWDKTIAAGETRNFGFQGAPGNIKDEPTDFKLKCDEFTTEVPLANITILEYTREKLGKVAGTTRCTVAFKADQDLLAWEARANGGTGVGIGLLVGEGSTLAAGEIGTFDVDTEELTLGDKEYTIKVYGKNQGGEWST